MGDIGPKFGYNSKNNGYLSFNRMRIPRTNIMGRYVNVDREGQFTVKGDLRVLYSVMMWTRCAIVDGCSSYLLYGLLIATRYSVVRRQFKALEGSKLERKLLDY